MDYRRLTHQGQALRAHHLVEEVGQGALDLRDFLAAIAFVVCPGCLEARRRGPAAIGLSKARSGRWC